MYITKQQTLSKLSPFVNPNNRLCVSIVAMSTDKSGNDSIHLAFKCVKDTQFLNHEEVIKKSLIKEVLGSTDSDNFVIIGYVASDRSPFTIRSSIKTALEEFTNVKIIGNRTSFPIKSGIDLAPLMKSLHHFIPYNADELALDYSNDIMSIYGPFRPRDDLTFSGRTPHSAAMSQLYRKRKIQEDSEWDRLVAESKTKQQTQQ